MKSTVNFTKNSKPYPKLMISDKGIIVLFTTYCNGFCVNKSESDLTIGSHSSNWDMSRFTDFDGTVTLQND